MLDYCLNETLADDGSFKLTPADNTVGEAYRRVARYDLDVTGRCRCMRQSQF